MKIIQVSEYFPFSSIHSRRFKRADCPLVGRARALALSSAKKQKQRTSDNRRGCSKTKEVYYRGSPEKRAGAACWKWERRKEMPEREKERRGKRDIASYHFPVILCTASFSTRTSRECRRGLLTLPQMETREIPGSLRLTNFSITPIKSIVL